MTLLEGAPRSHRVTFPLGILGILVAMTACAANQPPPATPPSTVVQAPPERLGATMMQPGDQPATPAVATEPSAPEPVSDAQLASLDDAHLLGVIQAITDRAVRITRVEESRGTDREVKRLARDLAASHVDTETRFEARLSEMGIAPASGPVSDQVRTEADTELAPLRSAHGKDLDRIYVDQQVRELTRALERVGLASRHVTRPELRAVIDGVRARLERDAREARAIRDTLLSGKTDWRPDAYDPDKVQR